MPAPFSLTELLTTPSADQYRAKLLAFLGSDANVGRGDTYNHGFPVADWVSNPDGMEMAFVNMVRSAVSDLVATKQTTWISSGWLAKATRLWLTYHAAKFYGVDRNPATKTTFNLQLSSVPGAPANSWVAGDVVVQGTSGLRYVSTTAGDLPEGGTVLVSFQAEAPGSIYNDDPSSGFRMVTAFAGVSASAGVGDFTAVLRNGDGNGRLVVSLTDATTPPTPTPGRYVFRIDVGGDPGVARYSLSFDGGPFIPQGTLHAGGVNLDFYGLRVTGVIGAGTPGSFVVGDTYSTVSPGGAAYVQGNDEESDASLIVRCQARWPGLSYNQTQDVFRLWAKIAYPSANRVSVRAHPLAPGKVQILVADLNGRIDPESASAIANYITPKLGSVLDSVAVDGAVEREVWVGGTVTVAAPSLAATQQIVDQWWKAYLGTIEIGGVVILSELKQIIMDAGAIDLQGLTLDGAVENLRLNRDEVPVMPTSADLTLQLVWAGA